MTDTYEPDDDAQDEPTPRDLRHQLAERSKEADELRRQLDTATRDAEFQRALGDNADAPWVKYFRSGYDGDVNAEAIRKAATDAGFLNVNQPRPQTQPEDLAANARMTAAADGAERTSPPDLLDAIRAAKTPEEVMAIVESEAGNQAGLRSTHQLQ